MIKFFKQYLQTAPYSEILQSMALLLFFLVFACVIFIIWKKPKNYYKEVSGLPLEEGEIPISNKKKQ